MERQMMQVSYFSNAMQLYDTRCKNKPVAKEQAPAPEEQTCG